MAMEDDHWPFQTRQTEVRVGWVETSCETLPDNGQAQAGGRRPGVEGLASADQMTAVYPDEGA
jgi:hypothetical protein